MFFATEGDSLTELAQNRADAILHINIPALQANYAKLAQKSGRADCAAVVKADAYGLGMEIIAPALWQAGCRQFFVAQLDEALTLRRALDQARIFVFGGLRAGTEREYLAHRLIPVFNRPAEIALWAAAAKENGQNLPAALHIDTGMNRLGLGADEAATLRTDGLPQGIKPVLLMSHLACADQPDHELNRLQQQRFATLAQDWAIPAQSLANSGGIFLGTDYHFSLTRPGIALYGSNPTPETENPMQPVVSMQARILQLRDIPAGESIGYGAEAAADHPRRMATVSAGYADGYPFQGAGGKARIGAHEAPIVGRISMDLITLDVTSLPPDAIREGQLADLIHSAYTVDDMAAAAGTIPYEILLRLSRRATRHYILPKPELPEDQSDDDEW